MSSLNLFGILVSIIPLLFWLIPFVLIVIIVMTYRKNSKRAEERLKIEQQQTFTLQQQVNNLTERIGKIENLLREVD